MNKIGIIQNNLTKQNNAPISYSKTVAVRQHYVKLT